MNKIIKVIVFVSVSLSVACNQSNNKPGTNEINAIKDSLQHMTSAISAGLTTKGPITWLDYFEDTPDFFMISDGEMKFNGYHSAEVFIKDTLVKAIKGINLSWQGMSVDVLSSDLAQITSSFHEDLISLNGAKIPVDGYFTGLAHLSATKGWQLRNVCWSTKPLK